MGEAVTMYSGASELAQGMSTELKCSKKKLMHPLKLSSDLGLRAPVESFFPADRGESN